MAESGKINRRRFLRRAPAGAALAAAVPAAAAGPGATPRSKEFRVGCLNVSSYSHLEGLWRAVDQPSPGGKRGALHRDADHALLGDRSFPR